ncbi:BZIP domain-containing protein [Fusarium keratoplasticum]|uniref:BZIP domain-containing protein n=1 Tax=Fusarium keratoplasticum TaxID=1328300 RepID=A0ACC0R479_9HYPO|nr:BZIP domain-containing protein [Fusarium keratoplasticum]KAI8675130.1 BZIP domain-containing protein [Fusarium keratoplasticum]KAI8681586.1 BZIP domain-containing protein [Fusarium keratoplasticum]
MDFTGQYNFPGTQPYHQFMPIPPLTPSHSHSAGSDDFNASPPENYDNLPTNHNDQFQAFDYASQGFNGNPHQPPTAFPGPPTPPGQNVFAAQVQSVHHQQQHGAAKIDSPEDQTAVRGGSEEDDNLTPAQSRRKAQNRAAQRAFRERKEKHVKDLEAKLAGLEAAQQQASLENERLKRDLQKMSTENEILRATSHVGHGSISPEPATGPMRFNPTEFYSNVLQNHTNKSPSHRIVTADDGERLLAAGAAWDFIISHELFKKGLVDIGDVSERLKHCARCDGQGPVFSERAIKSAIEQSVASGTDDLL